MPTTSSEFQSVDSPSWKAIQAIKILLKQVDYSCIVEEPKTSAISEKQRTKYVPLFCAEFVRSLLVVCAQLVLLVVRQAKLFEFYLSPWAELAAEDSQMSYCQSGTIRPLQVKGQIPGRDAAPQHDRHQCTQEFASDLSQSDFSAH